MAADGLHATVTVEGFAKTIAELKKFDAKAYRRMNSSIRQEMGVLEQTAKGFISNAGRSYRGTPLSGWRDVPARNGRVRGGAGWPAWNEGEIKAGISRTTAQGRVDANYRTNLYGLKNKSAAGVIFEIAGRNNKLSPFKRFLICSAHRGVLFGVLCGKTGATYNARLSKLCRIQSKKQTKDCVGSK
jgi:hypothetical protein